MPIPAVQTVIAMRALLNFPVSRRQLVAGAGALAGSLLVGWRPAAAAADDAARETDLAGWLRINPDDTVTVWCHQAEMGQGVMTALAALVAEELGVDWEQVRAEMPPSHPRFRTKRGRRVTGNSDSVMSSFDPLRTAGAAAREMLVAAAAAQWGVAAAECTAASGRVTHAATGRSAGYSELAVAAAALPVPQSPALKPRKQWQLIGRPLPRQDIPDKVAGTAVFGVDVELEGLKTATIMACPAFGGRLAKVDPAKALARPGVSHVVPLDNAVAVVGRTYWHALQGLKALSPEWDLAGASAADTDAIRAELRTVVDQDGAVGKATGDIAAAFAGAAKVVEAVYEAPYLAHLCMEPMNATVRIRGDRVDVWVPTQAETDTVNAVAKALGVPPDNVTVYTTMLGGGFGRRVGTEYAVQAALIARAVGGPVKLIWSREEDVRHDAYRPAMTSRYRAALDADGRVTAMTVNVAGPSLLEAFGMPPTMEPMIQTMASSGDAYRIPNLKLTFNRRDYQIPVGIWRSTNLSQHGFFVESFVDELAAAAGVDPLAMRRQLMGDNAKGVAVLDALAATFDFRRPRGRNRGVGLAVADGWNCTCAAAVDLSVEGEGGIRIHDVACVLHCGTVVNPAIVESQAQGAFLFGLDAALWGDITVKDGRVVQGNFNDQPVLRFNQAPAVRVAIVPSDGPVGGVGEIATAVAAPALANAIYAAAGRRVRSLPVSRAGITLLA
jgi:isoquinoline 1-oxidoreductase beta subunit